jgi:hypothetical protein
MLAEVVAFIVKKGLAVNTARFIDEGKNVTNPGVYQ